MPHISAVNGRVEIGGVRPNRVDGRVNAPSDELQMQPHPDGQRGTVTSREFQQDTWVTCEHIAHVRARPTFVIRRIRYMKHVVTFDRQTTNSANRDRTRGTAVLTSAGFLRNDVFTIMLNTKSVETCNQLDF